MTTVIGIRCPAGILLVADTQSTEGDIKQLNQPKIHLIGKDRYAIGCSGVNKDIDRFVNFLSLEFDKDTDTLYTYEELYRKLNDLVFKFIAEVKHDLALIGASTTFIEFDFHAIFAAPLSSEARLRYGKYGMYRIDIGNIVSGKPVASPIGKILKPTCVGSGEIPATAMLNAVEEYANRYGAFLITLNFKLLTLLLSQIVGTVSYTTTTSGKSTAASLTNCEGSKMLGDAEIREGRSIKGQIMLEALKEMPRLRKPFVELAKDILKKDETLLLDLIKSDKKYFATFIEKHQSEILASLSDVEEDNPDETTK